MRKIRCDAEADGCTHCHRQGVACYVTDRVTGRTERRGYLRDLEREKGAMEAYIRDLEKVMGEHGIEVMPWQSPDRPAYPPPGTTLDSAGNPVHGPDESQWTRSGAVWVKNKPQVWPKTSPQKPEEYPTGYSRSAVLQSRPVDSYLGVFTDNAPLSSIKGTRLSILGTTIDVTSFEAPDMDNDLPPGSRDRDGLFNKSMRAFLRSVMGRNPPVEDVELPSRHDAFRYSEWFFIAIFPFVPVLHKPSYMALVSLIPASRLSQAPTCRQLR